MRTEIVIPFAFDTAPVERLLQEHGKDEVMKILREMGERNLVECVPEQEDYYGNGTGNPNWARLMRDCFKEWLDGHSEEIVDEAALMLAQRGSSKRKWRDVLKGIKEGNDD